MPDSQRVANGLSPNLKTDEHGVILYFRSKYIVGMFCLNGDIRPIYFDVIFEYISEIINSYIKIMSKRLNKRQQREAEELELLKAEQDRVATEKAAPVEEEEDEEEEEEEVVEGEVPVNAFAAVGHFPLLESNLTGSSEEMRLQILRMKMKRRKRK
jgi:CO dehydrogenase/acetyl-CoA synthase beta subunit